MGSTRINGGGKQVMSQGLVCCRTMPRWERRHVIFYETWVEEGLED